VANDGLFSGTSAAGAGQLSCVGLVQRRLTVNATDESYQKAWQNMALAEEETRKRSAIIIKDGVRVQSKQEFSGLLLVHLFWFFMYFCMLFLTTM